MKNKSAIATTEAFKSILKKSKRKPKLIHVDEGKEFYNKIFVSLLKKIILNYIQPNPKQNHRKLNDGIGHLKQRCTNTLRQLK
jgi:hypothetical protein